MLETVVVAARKQLVRRHFVEADGALWPRAVETRARPESVGILLTLAVALLLALPLLLRCLAGRRLCALELGCLSLAPHRGDGVFKSVAALS